MDQQDRAALEDRYIAGIRALSDDPAAYADLLTAAATSLAASRLLFHVRMQQAATGGHPVLAHAPARVAAAR